MNSEMAYLNRFSAGLRGPNNESQILAMLAEDFTYYKVQIFLRHFVYFCPWSLPSPEFLGNLILFRKDKMHVS